MIDAEESVRVATAYASALFSLLNELGQADNPMTDAWAPIRGEIQRLYEMLGKRIEVLDELWDYEVKS